MVKVGTSGFSYRSWIGKIYPEGIKPSDMLLYYAKLFDAVEINATFYRHPRESTLKRWKAVGKETGLIFVLKAHRSFTHMGMKSEEEISVYVSRFLQIMKNTLGGILWQFPHSFKPAEETLKYLHIIATTHKGLSIPPFVELRNKLWHDITLPEGITPVSYHMVAKSKYMHTPIEWIEKDVVYIRLHGYGRKYGGSYPPEYLQKLCHDIKDKEGFVFFNNDADGHAPFNAMTLKECLTS
ncbi:MAG: DUF72 domain-containing protein [Dictyoglomi bacterium]|nr:DUF72 domain-containing protein [Dictyoglomota bacterium]